MRLLTNEWVPFAKFSAVRVTELARFRTIIPAVNCWAILIRPLTRTDLFDPNNLVFVGR